MSAVPPPPPPASWGTPGTAAPPPSAPVGEQGATVAPPAPRRRWVVVLVAVLAVIALVWIAGTVLFATRTWPPLAAAYDFTDDLDHGRIGDAYAQVCDADREEFGRADFEDATALLLADAINIEVNFLSVDRRDGTATVEFTVRRRNRRDRTYELRVINEDGDWKPCSYR